MNLGAHMSIAGGLHLACERARLVGAHVMQIFVKNERQWKAPKLKREDVAAFRFAMKHYGVRTAFAHDTYLHNMASSDAALWEKSWKAFAEELRRAEELGLAFLVTHPGAAKEAGTEQGIKNMARAINRVHQATRGIKVRIVLEMTAGQGSCIGHRFEHMRDILDRVDDPKRVGICVDTCHIFAAGYDIRTPKGYEKTMAEFDRIVGLDKIDAFHVNDSKKPLGSRVDRHENIGRGHIGRTAFRCLVNDDRFREIPMVLETPKENDMDIVNLKLLRRLRKKEPCPV